MELDLETFLTILYVREDEIGQRVGGQLHWLHIMSSETLTYYAHHQAGHQSHSGYRAVDRLHRAPGA